MTKRHWYWVVAECGTARIGTDLWLALPITTGEDVTLIQNIIKDYAGWPHALVTNWIFLREEVILSE